MWRGEGRGEEEGVEGRRQGWGRGCGGAWVGVISRSVA